MPTKLQLLLAGQAPPRPTLLVDYRHANGLRAKVYDSLALINEQFAQEMHADSYPKPFTISPLYWQNNCWLLEITVLWDPAASLLLQGLAAKQAPWRLGHEEYCLHDVRISESATVEDIIARAKPTRQLQVDFLTPTTNHETLLLDESSQHKVKIGYPFPDPSRIISSWYHKWNCLMGRMGWEGIPSVFLDYLPRVALSRMQGETQEIRLSEKQCLVGFVGMAVFDVLHADSAPPELLTTLHLLADFANFAGTGVETMRGMGQTRARER